MILKLHVRAQSVTRAQGILLRIFTCACLLAGAGVLPAGAQSPSDPGFWVVLPDGQRVPFNHPLATGSRPAPAPSRAARPPAGVVLGPSDPGFWVTLPNGARVPYNHPDALADSGPAPSPAPASAAPPSEPAAAVLSPSDPGFWVRLPGGALVPYNHPDAAGTSSSEAPPPPAPEESAPRTEGQRLRVLQWNLHHGVGTDGRYDIARLASWMARMNPDVVTLNEVEKHTYWGREDQPARYAALLGQLTGRRWYALFSQEFGDWDANGKGHLILSTYPFEFTARRALSYDRVAGAAGINVNGRMVSLIVTHLDPESGTRRSVQAREVVNWASSLPENRILTGDMNGWPDQAAISVFRGAYRDSWADAAAAGQAIGFAGLYPAGATRNGRIDYIFWSAAAPHLRVLQSKVFDTRDSRGAMPSDHRPVLTTFDVR